MASDPSAASEPYNPNPTPYPRAEPDKVLKSFKKKKLRKPRARGADSTASSGEDGAVPLKRDEGKEVGVSGAGECLVAEKIELGG